MSAPVLESADETSLTLQWEPLPIVPVIESYELQWRPADRAGARWITASNKLKGTTIRKKNLEPGAGYMFRVRPKVGGEWGHFSAPSGLMSCVEEPTEGSGGESFLGRRVQ